MVDSISKTIIVNFVLPPGIKSENELSKYSEKYKSEIISVKAEIGDNLLQTAHKNNLNSLLRGNCDGACACATCHVIIDKEWFDNGALKLNEYSDESEADMLDMAFDLEESSRLGCQVTLTEKMDGIIVHIPKSS